MVHKLKILPQYFDAVVDGTKTFEIRKNDRDFKIGDILFLHEWNPANKQYTGQTMTKQICYITNYAQKYGYVVLGIQPCLNGDIAHETK